MFLFQTRNRNSDSVFRVGFGTCPEFNSSIEKNIDSQTYNPVAFDFNSRKAFRNVDLVVPLTIGETLHLRHHWPRFNRWKFLVPEAESVAIADDKTRFNSFLQTEGYGAFLPESVNGRTFPFVVKKKTDCGAQHTFLINSPDDEQTYHEQLNDPDYFRQPYVPGDTEFTTHIIFLDGIRFHCTVQFSMNCDFYIRGVRMQPFKNVQITIVPTPFETIFSNILSDIGFSGTCCFNYKIVDGRPILFELNPRFGGSLPRNINAYLATLMGLLR